MGSPSRSLSLTVWLSPTVSPCPSASLCPGRCATPSPETCPRPSATSSQSPPATLWSDKSLRLSALPSLSPSVLMLLSPSPWLSQWRSVLQCPERWPGRSALSTLPRLTMDTVTPPSSSLLWSQSLLLLLLSPWLLLRLSATDMDMAPPPTMHTTLPTLTWLSAEPTKIFQPILDQNYFF